MMTPAPTPKEIELELTLRRFEERLAEIAAEKRSLTDQVKVQGDKVIRLEAENVRLKMQRTDAALATEVEGLRSEVGRKDRALVDYRRQLDKFLENEKLILRRADDNEKMLLQRATSAEQKIVLMQTTMERMQKARDAAYLEVEKHDRERLEAVSKIVAASDRARKAEERLAQFEKKPTTQQKKK
jgi:CheY-like chemotaxis protein